MQRQSEGVTIHADQKKKDPKSRILKYVFFRKIGDQKSYEETSMLEVM